MKTKKQNDPLFIYKCTFLLLIALVVCAATGVSMIWMRNQVARSARTESVYRNEITSIDRKLEYVNERIASAESPERLRIAAQQFGLELRLPESAQVVRMTPRNIDRNEVVFAKGDPSSVSHDLALLDSYNALGN